MPLMPAIRPFTSTSSAAAAPMITPPITADHGVKAVQSMLIDFSVGTEAWARSLAVQRLTSQAFNYSPRRRAVPADRNTAAFPLRNAASNNPAARATPDPRRQRNAGLPSHPGSPAR